MILNWLNTEKKKTLPAVRILPKLQCQGSPAVHTSEPEDPEKTYQMGFRPNHII